LKPTSFILSDISEKIVAAMALRSLQTKMPKLLEEAIEATVALWDEKPHGSLTYQDIFYVKLSKIQNVFEALADIADDRIAAQSQTTVSVAHFINDINSIVIDNFKNAYPCDFDIAPLTIDTHTCRLDCFVKNNCLFIFNK